MQPVMTFYTADWCTWCQKAKPTVEKLAAEFPQVELKVVNLNTMEERQEAKRQGITEIPLVVLEGSHKMTISGNIYEPFLRANLEEVTKQ